MDVAKYLVKGILSNFIQYRIFFVEFYSFYMSISFRMIKKLPSLFYISRQFWAEWLSLIDIRKWISFNTFLNKSMQWVSSTAIKAKSILRKNVNQMALKEWWLLIKFHVKYDIDNTSLWIVNRHFLSGFCRVTALDCLQEMGSPQYLNI